MTKALTRDDARDALDRQWDKHIGGLFGRACDITRALEALLDAKIAIARQERAALSDGEEQRIRDLLGDPRVGASVGTIPEAFSVSTALSDGDRTRADDAQVGGGAGQAGDDVVLDAASRLREADHQALANTLQVHDAKQRQRIANLVQALRLQMIYEATIPDGGGKDGPKGRAYAAFVQARDAALKEVSS